MLKLYFKQVEIIKVILSFVTFMTLRFFLNLTDTKVMESFYESIIPFILSLFILDIVNKKMYAFERNSVTTIYKNINFKFIVNIIAVCIPVVLCMTIFKDFNYILLCISSVIVLTRIVFNTICLTNSHLLGVLIIIILNVLWFDARVPSILNFYSVYLDYTIYSKLLIVGVIILSEYFVRRKLND